MTSPDAVDARGLCRRYGRRWALADVSFRVAAGRERDAGRPQRLGQVHAAARARHRRSAPTAATARVAGHDIRQDARRGAAARSRSSAIESYLYESLTARENLARSPRRFLEPARRDRARRRCWPRWASPSAPTIPCPPSPPGCASGSPSRASLLQDGGARPARRALRRARPAGLPPRGRRPRHACGARGATVVMATHLLDRGRATAATRRSCSRRARLQLASGAGRGELPADGAGDRARMSAARSAALRKDLLLQWRTRGAVRGRLRASAPPRSCSSASRSARTRAPCAQHAAGFLWLALLLSSTLDPRRELPGRDGAPRARGPAAAARVARAPLLRQGARQLGPARAPRRRPRAGHGRPLRRRRRRALSGPPRGDRSSARPASPRPERCTRP